ncbi:hypothetical protein E2C01_067860 [Portunus trituberculatus]|uniref:Uncharacterized protein n=1 Tax=Portunus trituberculatus TaxID=210409 RepID=A0A5B7HXX9_PORTR|nr:hypothetical protein [Portunus trituberculatus]
MSPFRIYYFSTFENFSALRTSAPRLVVRRCGGANRDDARVASSKGVRDGGVHQRGSMSAITRFKQSVSHGKERKAHQPLPTSTWATPCSVLISIAYVGLVTTSALGVGLSLRPWNISCFVAHACSLNILHYAPLALRPGHQNTQPVLPPGSLRRPPLLATYCPSSYLCFLRKTGQLPRL